MRRKNTGNFKPLRAPRSRDSPREEKTKPCIHFLYNRIAVINGNRVTENLCTHHYRMVLKIRI